MLPLLIFLKMSVINSFLRTNLCLIKKLENINAAKMRSHSVSTRKMAVMTPKHRKFERNSDTRMFVVVFRSEEDTGSNRIKDSDSFENL